MVALYRPINREYAGVRIPSKVIAVNRRAHELKQLLKSARSRLSPDEVGIASYGRRRVPGLRREEVAELAGLNPSYYARFERGERSISLKAVERVIAALRLSESDAQRLIRIAFPPIGALGFSGPAETGIGVPELQIVRRFFSEVQTVTSLHDLREAAVRAICDAAQGRVFAYWNDETPLREIRFTTTAGRFADHFRGFSSRAGLLNILIASRC